MAEAGLVTAPPDGQLVPRGSPNLLRHTVLTWHDSRGVPEAQIDAASGHAGRGTRRRNYVHLRREHFREWEASVEALFAEIGRHGSAHLRYQCNTNVVELSTARPAKPP